MIKTICYPSLYKVNTKATKYDQKHESGAIKAYETPIIESMSCELIGQEVWVIHQQRIHFLIPPLIFLCRVTLVEMDVEKLNVQ